MRLSFGDLDRFLLSSTGDRSLRDVVGDFDRCLLIVTGEAERSRTGGGVWDFWVEVFAAEEPRSHLLRLRDGDLPLVFALDDSRTCLSRLGDGDVTGDS